MSLESTSDEGEIQIFTDGSKIHGRTGAGVATYKDGIEVSVTEENLPSSTTVFEAEMFAINLVAHALLIEKNTE